MVSSFPLTNRLIWGGGAWRLVGSTAASPKLRLSQRIVAESRRYRRRTSSGYRRVRTRPFAPRPTSSAKIWNARPGPSLETPFPAPGPRAGCPVLRRRPAIRAFFRQRKKARIAGRRRRTGQPALGPGAGNGVSNEGPGRAFQIFADEVGRGAKGLVLTRLYPEDVRRRYRLDSATILWLSRSFGEAAVDPTNLQAPPPQIKRFVSGKED